MCIRDSSTGRALPRGLRSGLGTFAAHVGAVALWEHGAWGALCEHSQTALGAYLSRLRETRLREWRERVADVQGPSPGFGG
eukprot:7575379-Alexandrium_andersonii.AAC.1